MAAASDLYPDGNSTVRNSLLKRIVRLAELLHSVTIVVELAGVQAYLLCV